MTISAQELANELMDAYRRKCGAPRRDCGFYVMLNDAPKAWKEACMLAGQYGRTIHGLFSTCFRAGIPPLPVTPRSIEIACEYLRAQAMDPRIRKACWLTAIRSLPADRPDLADPELVKPTAPIRRLNAPAGTFPKIEKDLSAWTTRTCAQLSTPFEERIMRSPGTARGMCRHLLCAATVLRDLTDITSDTTLEQLLEEATFNQWLQHQGDERPTSVLATIHAFIGVRVDLFGDDATVTHMRAQKSGRRDNNKLPGQGLAELSSMLDDPRQVELIPVALMIIAGRSEVPDRVRLKLANLAPAMNLAIDYALMPTEIFSAEHDKGFAFHPPVRLRKAALSPLPKRSIQQALLRQRWAIREALGAAATCHLMTTFSGLLMESKICAQSLDRTQRQFGLISHPWQRYRDFAAGRLLINDPGNLQRVADLLQVKIPALVELRYREVMPRSSPTPKELV